MKRITASRFGPQRSGLASSLVCPGRVDDAILTPPLRRFLDHCYEVADRGTSCMG